MHSRANKPSGRQKRSLQENQAKAGAGCAYGNGVSPCFALRRPPHHRSLVRLVFASDRIAAKHTFKDLLQLFTIVTLLFF